MRRYLTSPKWWAGHLLVLALAVVFVKLGFWQFDRAQEPGGGGQNMGYALQWPLFALFVVLGWARILWLEARGPRREPSTARAPVPSPPARSRPVQEDEPDDELAAYNAYLARLAEQDRRRA